MSIEAARTEPVRVFCGPEIAAYAFGEDHPFGPDRHAAFMAEFECADFRSEVRLAGTQRASRDQLSLFHEPGYVERVAELSARGFGLLDGGDTPVVPGIYEAACAVVGTTLAATDALMRGDCARAFVPIAGLHHAGRDRAAGFCVFNDCGVAVEHLRRQYGLTRIAYVDIDAHHGDGVFYAFEEDADVWFADIHEDGRYLYPGTGAAEECGRGAGAGRKLNIPLPPGAGDEAFAAAWDRVEAFVESASPEFIILQCGADGLAGDPLTHLEYTARCHARATRALVDIARRLGHGRVLALGGGGYDRRNLARAWCAVVRAFLYTNPGEN